VLHNVGNVLNSVNVSAGIVAERVQNSKAAALAKVVEVLQEHRGDLATFITNDPRGKHLVTYLTELSDYVRAEQAHTLGEVDSLRNNIEHIKDIVTMQQSYAKVAGVNELVNPVDLVEDSLRMNAGALTRHAVHIVREFAAVPTVNLDKHKVIQILVNLVRNAKYACDDSHRADKQVTLRVSASAAHVEIAVIDNGVGIAPENLTRIFSHGFTTRKDGHGFGLHSAALAAKELGGSLTVHSDGVGRGAAFVLRLPLQAEPLAQSA
jgi:signal transduction histidine kinase